MAWFPLTWQWLRRGGILKDAGIAPALLRPVDPQDRNLGGAVAFKHSRRSQ
ncbi:MAG TPA: hypothetical protein VHZ03_24045 [Trebonia sp.]|jgi:hypothetical protein|nr:hypothetical protein [Trebonia sp.]